ncbi:SDR family oxidoreductase [Kaarinaea lacus]
MDYVLIVGAKSDTARALAREYASHGYGLYLAARNCQDLEGLVSDLKIRYNATAKPVELDILDYHSHAAFYNNLDEKPVGVITTVGYLGDQVSAQKHLEETLRVINTNYTGIVGLLNIIANDFEERDSGFIVALSSVAGDRGRKANYIYGSAKAGLSAYLSGLRNRLSDTSVHVMTVKPGFMNTSMTKGMDLPAALTAQPRDVAKQIYTAQQNKKNVIYVKWLWRWIMLIIQHIPEFIFKRTSI